MRRGDAAKVGNRHIRPSAGLGRGALTRRDFLGTSGKALGATLLATSGIPLLSACSDSGGSSGEPLSFWQFYGPAPEGEGVAAQSQWFVDAVAAWNEENDQQIELRYVPPGDYIGGTQLQTAFASGEGPDIFLLSPGDFLRYYNGDVLTDLTPYIADEAMADLFPEVRATREVEGGLYAVPMEVEPMAMFYSVQAFEEAGLSEGDIPETWDDLLAVAEQLTTPDRFGVLFETAPGYYQNFTWYPFMWQGGGEAIDVEARESAFASEGTVAALEFWQTAVEEGFAPREYPGDGGFDIAGNLLEGFCAMQNIGIWAVAALRDADPDFPYGVFKLPVPEGGSYTTDMGGWAFAANATGRNPEGAGQFIAWALASMEEDSIQRGVDWIIEAKSDLSPRESVLQRATELGGFDDGPMQVFRDEIFPDGRAEPRLPPEVYQPISDAIQACQLAGEDGQAQAEAAQEAINSFLSGYDGAL